MSRKLALYSRPAANDFFPLPRVQTSGLKEAHGRLADEHRRRERYRLARRHYRIALRIDPHDAALHFGLARAWEDDPHGSDDHAYAAYRRAAKLDRASALHYAAVARSAVRTGHDAVARKAIAKAVQLAPTNANVLELIVEACREADWLERAATIVCAARFQAPQCSAIRALWDRIRYDRAAKKNDVKADTQIINVLPFLRLDRGEI